MLKTKSGPQKVSTIKFHDPAMTISMSSMFIFPLRTKERAASTDVTRQPWWTVLETIRSHAGCEGLSWGFQLEDPSKLTVIAGMSTQDAFACHSQPCCERMKPRLLIMCRLEDSTVFRNFPYRTTKSQVWTRPCRATIRPAGFLRHQVRLPAMGAKLSHSQNSFASNRTRNSLLRTSS